MLKVVRTPAAHRDISGIAEAISDSNVEAALRFIDELDAIFRHLSQFPELGESVEWLRPGMRRTSRSPYSIYYRILGETIEIDRVVHGARDIDQIF